MRGPARQRRSSAKLRSRLKQLLLTSGSGLARVGIGAVLFPVGVPLMVSSLGMKRYGVWVLITTVTGWLAFADFGLRTAIVRQGAVTSVGGRDGVEQANRLVGNAVVLYAVILLPVVLAAAFLTPWMASVLFKIERGLVSEAALVLRLGVWAFVVDVLSLGLFRAVLDGFGHISRANGIHTVHSVMRWCAIVGLAVLTHSLRAMAVGSLLSSLVVFAIWRWQARRRVPCLRYRPVMPSRQELRDLLVFSGFSQANDFIGAATPQVIELIVVRKMGLSTLAIFDIGVQLAIHVRTAISAVWFPTMPILARMHARSQSSIAEAGQLSRRALEFLSLAGVGLLGALGGWLFRLWLGSAGAGASPLLTILVSTGIVQGSLLASVYRWNAEGVPWRATQVMAIYSASAILGAWASSLAGVQAVAWAWFLAAAIALLLAAGFSSSGTVTRGLFWAVSQSALLVAVETLILFAVSTGFRHAALLAGLAAVGGMVLAVKTIDTGLQIDI